MELESAEKQTVRTFVIAILIGIPLVVLKVWAYMVSGFASSILASLVDSVIDIAVSGMHGLAMWYAIQPADDCHRHGHGKMEALSALIQVAMLIGGGGFLIYHAVSDFGSVPTETDNTLAIILMVISAGLTFGLAKYQHHVMQHTDSLALEADHSHYWTDSILYAGVLFALFLHGQFGLWWANAAVASIAGAYMIKVGWDILQKSLDMLLDAEIEEEEREKIKDLILSVPEINDIHDLRCTKRGMKYAVSFDFELPPTMNLKEAHAIGQKAEKLIVKEFTNVEVMFHIDPIGEPEDSRHKVMKDFHRE